MNTSLQAPPRAGALEIDELHIQYGAHVALQRMSLRIAPGTIHGIIGPAGSGKTSFLRTLNRMSLELDSASVTGRVTFDGSAIVGDDVTLDAYELARLRRRMGIVFATPQPLPRSIYENVAYGPRMAGMRDKEALDDVVERSLRAVHMWDEVSSRLSMSGMQLSGGQQQRLCLARTLALNPSVVLLDEPCSALDPISTARIEETMRTLQERITFVLVTNTMRQAQRVCDTTSFFLMGEHIETAPTSDLFNAASHPKTRAYLAGQFG